MTTVFIAGSITIKRLHPMVRERIQNVVTSEFEIIVGDADGADSSIQQYLKSIGASRTTVYCSGASPRNNLGGWAVHGIETGYEPGSRAFFTAKDLAMAEVADFGLMVWDAKSTGTLSNVIELLGRKKKSVVFVNKEERFVTVGNVEQLEGLVECMSDHAKRKALEKIRLQDRIDSLRHEQPPLF